MDHGPVSHRSVHDDHLRPVHERTTTRVPGSCRRAATVELSSSTRLRPSAFRAAGRFSVKIATPWCCSTPSSPPIVDNLRTRSREAHDAHCDVKRCIVDLHNYVLLLDLAPFRGVFLLTFSLGFNLRISVTG